MFDLITYLFGKILSADSYLKIKDFGDDPTISSILELNNGLICNIVGVNGHQFRIFDIDVIGTKGRLIVNSSKQVTQYISGPSHRSSEFNELHQVYESDFTFPENEYFISALEDIEKCIFSGSLPKCSGEDAVLSLEAIIGVRRSYEESKKIFFPLVSGLQEKLITQ